MNIKKFLLCGNCTDYFYTAHRLCVAPLHVPPRDTVQGRRYVYYVPGCSTFFILNILRSTKPISGELFTTTTFKTSPPVHFLIRQHPRIIRRTTTIKVKHPSGSRHEVIIPAAKAIAHLPRVLQQFIVSIPFQKLIPTFILLSRIYFVTIEFA